MRIVKPAREQATVCSVCCNPIDTRHGGEIYLSIHGRLCCEPCYLTTIRQQPIAKE